MFIYLDTEKWFRDGGRLGRSPCGYLHPMGLGDHPIHPRCFKNVLDARTKTEVRWAVEVRHWMGMRAGASEDLGADHQAWEALARMAEPREAREESTGGAAPREADGGAD